ncbi:MAG: orotidine-5'-phosphate decarboxylase [Actinomycetota bacterium]|nr:orotidine-5'-phosphate decarboxylase [Actinomycetota bacterium]
MSAPPDRGPADRGGGEPGTGFGERVVRAVQLTGPLCAGIDPSPSLLAAWGLPDDAHGLRELGRRCVDAFAGVVPVVKPQVAFYERHGSAGFAALEDLLGEARSAGLLVIADAKRGDIGSTSAAYAGAWLDDGSPLAADAVTAVAYMGLGALAPMLDAARRSGRAVIVVARSSNPEGSLVQDSLAEDGRRLGDRLLDDIARMNAEEVASREGTLDAGVPGALGAVVGATLRRVDATLPRLGGVILAPGVGAQGATGSDVAALFAGCPSGTVLPSASRSVLGAGPDRGPLRRAAAKLRDEMSAALC